jgi:AraC-like DNA-binding protein
MGSGSKMARTDDIPDPHAPGDLLPDREVVDVPQESSFKVWSHGYPFRTVRWHFHPEYEIHLVTQTSGRSFIGDYIGGFEPGNLVLTGPYLPHNWISDVKPGEVVEERGLVLQFTREFIEACMATMPELRGLEELFTRARVGLEFAEGSGWAARPLLQALKEATGAERIGLFFKLLALLEAAPARQLASRHYEPDSQRFLIQPLNHVMDHVANNLSGHIKASELAELSGFSPWAFSRAFKQHAGVSFVRYVTEMRINRACELLAKRNLSVTDICFQVGFNNVSNFNRHFLALKGMSPTRYRSHHQRNVTGRASDRSANPAGKPPGSLPERLRADYHRALAGAGTALMETDKGAPR